MKKKYLILGVIFCLILTGCGNSKKELTATTIEEFNLAASKNNFTTEDNMEKYKDISYIKEASIAKTDDISIELIVYDNEESAKNVQEAQIEKFKSRKSTGASKVQEKGLNYYKYKYISNGYYSYIIRVDNTLVFCDIPLTEKDKVEKIINDIKY